MIQYILECVAFQLVFLIIYDFFLKRETFFQWNRLYLLGTHVLSLLLPWIKIEAFKTTVPLEYNAYPEFLWNLQTAPFEISTAESSRFNISWQEGILILGILAASVLFVYKMWQLYQLRKKGEIHYYTEFTQIIVANSNLAFSFFKSIFLGDKLINEDYERIIKHELIHIKQRHSWDLLFFELLRIVFWFNPLVYIYQSRISELHEFIADAQVAKTNKKEQYQLLLSQVFQTQHISFVNQFFKSSLIKKRIVMLQKSRSKKVWQLKYLLLLPIVMGMLFYSSLEGQETTTQANNQDQELIEEIREELKSDIAISGLIKELFSKNKYGESNNSQNYILSKEDFFRRQILWQEMTKEINRKNNKGALKSDLKVLEDPSTILYNSYFNRERAFQLLDENLKYSIGAFESEVHLIDKTGNYPDEYYVFEVVDVTDLTGMELRAFNNKLDEIFEKEDSDYKAIILTDKQYAFEVRAVINGDTAETNDYSELSNNSATAKYNELVAERKRLLKSSDENNPIIINLDQQLRGLKNQMQTDPNMTDQTSSNLDEKYNQLVLERNRLLKNGDEKNPIIVNLDQQLQGLKRQMQFDQDMIVPFALVEEAPVFPGCENEQDLRECFQTKLQLHISKNFKYPGEAQKQGIQGRVNIMFTIDQNGDITNIRKRGPHKLLEVEAERIITLLPKMQPGVHKGKKVKVPFSIPITFKLQGKGWEPDLTKLANMTENIPIFFVDGEASTKEIVLAMKQEEIEAIFALKGEAALKKYGDKGKNGVVEITSKKKE